MYFLPNKNKILHFYGVVHREGKRVFIDEQAYLRWRNRNSENK